MTRQLKQEIDLVVKQLVANYRPEKVIVFGSAARGEATDESDLDLLVIKRTDKAFYDRIIEARRGVRVNRAMDLVVYTPQEFDKARTERRLFVRHVLKYGRMVYEASV